MRHAERISRTLLPLAAALALLLGWEFVVRWHGIPHYILPAPSRVISTLYERWDSLAPSLWFTVRLTLLALAAAVVGGVLLASAFVLSKRLAAAFFPLAVVLQVTPLIAIAPLILIYVENTTAALRVAGGLALVGAVVAEFTAGTAGRETGLASRILEASFRTDTPMMFAALLLTSLLGVAIFASLSLLSRWLIGHWHDSEQL